MRRLTCTACKGKGVVTVPEPWQTCPTCGGSGRAPIEYDLPCTTCSGKGVVAA
jgi:DnaJ-class molecular chaperone